MAKESTGRVALMSIHPEYANAIVDGRKTIEFRKRPLSSDVTHVVVYSTSPESAVIGYFSVAGQAVQTPHALWDEYAQCGFIDHDSYFDYYAGKEEAAGIRVGTAQRFKNLLDLKRDLGVKCAPQSFQYLDREVFLRVVSEN